MSKAKVFLIGTAVTLCIVTPAVLQQRIAQSLRARNQALLLELQQLRDAAQDTQRRLQQIEADSSRLRKQDEELAQLRGALAQARQQVQPPSSPPEVRPSPAATNENQHPSAPPALSEAEVTAFLQKPRLEQGDFLGRVRRQSMGMEKRDADFERNRTLAEEVRPRLEDLESHPDQFADFQTSFVKAAIGLEDEERVKQLRDVVQRTYEQALADKLEAASRPSDQEAVQAWAARRDALDRRATHQVQALLTPDERARFDRAFLGIMGIDLGLHDGAWHRFTRPDGGVVFPSESGTP